MPATSNAPDLSPLACTLVNSALTEAASTFGEQQMYTLAPSGEMTSESPYAKLIATHSLGSTGPIEFRIERVRADGGIRFFYDGQPKPLLDAVKKTLDQALVSNGLSTSIGVD